MRLVSFDLDGEQAYGRVVGSRVTRLDCLMGAPRDLASALASGWLDALPDVTVAQELALRVDDARLARVGGVVLVRLAVLSGVVVGPVEAAVLTGEFADVGDL
ncbi:MAG: hypothetical protein V4521_01270, partial [Pseudomonadota bacterium]